MTTVVRMFSNLNIVFMMIEINLGVKCFLPAQYMKFFNADLSNQVLNPLTIKS